MCVFFNIRSVLKVSGSQFMKRLQITYKTVKVKYRASHQQWFSSLSFFSLLILSFWDIALFWKCKIGRGLTAPPSKALGARPYCFLFSFFVLSSPNNGKRASGAMALSSDVNKRQFWSNKNGPACCHRAEQTSMSANPPPHGALSQFVLRLQSYCRPRYKSDVLIILFDDTTS